MRVVLSEDFWMSSSENEWDSTFLINQYKYSSESCAQFDLVFLVMTQAKLGWLGKHYQ